MNDYNPESVERAIHNCANRIAKGVNVCAELYEKYLEADHAYDVAFAHAYLDAKGPAHAKKYMAELATQDERRARNVADAAYRHADRKAKALEAELRAWQSVGASVRSMYGAAGRGEY
ncbi:hypothetical protein [Nocardia sp. NPDC019302]|uniref:hypothetical protein n=1 Tax=Nocardia sp. NPDC019302 TaxID=3154592 RepID=UPI0033D7B51D